MRKLKLAFEELDVESFVISRGAESRGTAYAHADTAFDADTAYVVNPFADTARGDEADTTIDADTTLDADTAIDADTTIAPR